MFYTERVSQKRGLVPATPGGGQPDSRSPCSSLSVPQLSIRWGTGAADRGGAGGCLAWSSRLGRSVFSQKTKQTWAPVPLPETGEVKGKSELQGEVASWWQAENDSVCGFVPAFRDCWPQHVAQEHRAHAVTSLQTVVPFHSCLTMWSSAVTFLIWWLYYRGGKSGPT